VVPATAPDQRSQAPARYFRWPGLGGCMASLAKGRGAMDGTRANGGALWERADLFFLCDALSRGMSIQDLAGFLNRSVEEVRGQADSRGGKPAD
jgi:hypothetical protein